MSTQVHMIFEGTYGEAWGADEKKSCKLMFIGKNLDADELRAGFDKCRVAGDEPPAKKAKTSA